MVVQEQLYTAADIWHFAHDAGNPAGRYELIEAELFEMSPVGRETS